MRAIDEVLAALSCPLAERDAVTAMSQLGSVECAAALRSWVVRVFELNPQLTLALDSSEPSTSFRGKLELGGDLSSIAFHVIDETAARLAAGGDVPLQNVDADVMVFAVKADSDDPDIGAAVETLQHRAGSPVAAFVIMDPGWLAAAVINRSKPFAYTGLHAGGPVSSTPYFPEVPAGGATASTRVTRTNATMRAALEASIFTEAQSLAEKIREEGSRIRPATNDLMLVTTFLPPVTHSRTALVRYYTQEGTDEAIVSELVDSRQDAEISAVRAQCRNAQYMLVLDRQQIEEYCAQPEYYQMTLTADELDEQIATWLGLFDIPNYSVALCPEPVDIPFSLQGTDVTIRGDRRNRSEPRRGRLSGLHFSNPSIAEEFRREAWSLLQMTEPEFKDKNFIGPWVRALARRYRQDLRRHGH